MSKRSPKTAGFTLVEIAVTVAILGIIAALALNGLTSTNADAKARSEVREVLNAMKSVRSQVKTRARLTAPPMTVRSGGFTVDTPTTYSLWVSPDAAGVPAANRRIVQAGTIDAVTQVTITSPAPGGSLIITSEGTSNAGGTDRIVLNDAKANRVSNIVVSLGGKVSIQ